MHIQLSDSKVRHLPIQHGQLRKYGNLRVNDQPFSLYLPSLASHKIFFFLGKLLSADDNICCCSVTKLCLTLCDPMNCSTPGSLVFHSLPKFAQTHVH